MPFKWMKDGARLENKVYGVPKEIDREIGRLKLTVIVIEIDGLLPEQGAYLKSEDMGT